MRAAVVNEQSGLLYVYDLTSQTLLSRHGTPGIGMNWRHIGWLTPEAGRELIYGAVGNGVFHAAFLDPQEDRIRLLTSLTGVVIELKYDCFDISPDGKFVIATIEDGITTGAVVELATARIYSTFARNSPFVAGGCDVSPDGPMVASPEAVWNLANGTLLSRPTSSTGDRARYSADGREVIMMPSRSGVGGIATWNVESGKVDMGFLGAYQSDLDPWVAEVSRDRKSIAVVYEDRHRPGVPVRGVRIHSLGDRRVLAEGLLPDTVEHSGHMLGLAWSPDSSRLYVCTSRGIISYQTSL